MQEKCKPVRTTWLDVCNRNTLTPQVENSHRWNYTFTCSNTNAMGHTRSVLTTHQSSHHRIQESDPKVTGITSFSPPSFDEPNPSTIPDVFSSAQVMLLLDRQVVSHGHLIVLCDMCLFSPLDEMIWRTSKSFIRCQNNHVVAIIVCRCVHEEVPSALIVVSTNCR